MLLSPIGLQCSSEECHKIIHTRSNNQGVSHIQFDYSLQKKQGSTIQHTPHILWSTSKHSVNTFGVFSEANKASLIFKCVSYSSNNSCQICWKRWVTICPNEITMPCNLKIWFMKSWIIVVGANGSSEAQKWSYLERQSTTTMMKNLSPILGRPIIKSIERSIKTVVGINSIYNVSRVFNIWPIFPWQASHSASKVSYPLTSKGIWKRIFLLWS